MRKRKKFVYRKIYEQHYGPIPVDSEGRTFDVHHADFDPTNDNPKNLVALSIVDHFWVHWINGDYGACLKIATKMRQSPETLSTLARQYQLSRVANGTHHFLDKKFQSKQGKKGFAKNVENGTARFLDPGWQKELALKRVADGTCAFCDSETQRELARRALENGTHSSQKVHTCPHCGKVGKGGGMLRWHFENCKEKR